jgi:hypothetical protein
MELDDEQFASPGVVGVNMGPDDDGAYLYKRHLVEFIEQPSIAERPIDKNSRMTYIGEYARPRSGEFRVVKA